MKALLVLLLCLPLASQQKNVVFFSHDANGFSATGKWVSPLPDPKEQPATPHEVQIDCDRQQRQCIAARAEYYMGHPHVSIDYFSITRWDRNGITASSAAGTCMTNLIIINFGDKSITEVDSLKALPDDQKKACAFFGVANGATWTFVAKGTDRWEREHWPGLSDVKK